MFINALNYLCQKNGGAIDFAPAEKSADESLDCLRCGILGGGEKMGAIIVICDGCAAKNKISDMKQHLHPRCGKCRKALDIRDHAVPIDLGDASLDEFLKAAQLPVLVDFFSPTCGPCASLAPLLVSLARQFLGRILVAKVDTSKNPGCAAHFHIRGVPTLIFFKNGRELEQIVGLPDTSHLQAKMEYYAG